MADDFTRRRFAWLDQVAADSKVSPAGFVLAYRIAKFFNRDTGEAWPAQPTLAAAMRMDSGPSQWHVGMPKKCPKCSYLKAPKLLICPACGFKPEPKCKVVHADGDLVEFSSRNIPKQPSNTEHVEFYRQLKHVAVARGYKAGWIAHKYKEKFAHWPSGLDHLAPMPPTPATLGWIRSRQIAFAMGRR